MSPNGRSIVALVVSASMSVGQRPCEFRREPFQHAERLIKDYGDGCAPIALTMIDNGRRIVARKQTPLNTLVPRGGCSVESSAVGRFPSSLIRSHLLLWARLRVFLRRRMNGGYVVWRCNCFLNLGVQSSQMSNRTDPMRLSEMVLRLDDVAQ